MIIMAVKTGKKKKKLWYSVIASKEFNNVFIGEIPSFDPKSLIGRCVNVNLMTLIGNPKKQNVNIKFRINNVTEKNASTEMISYELSNSYVKRMVRKSRSKLDNSFVLESKDKVRFRVKPFVITKNKVQKSVLSAIRKELMVLLEKNVKENNFGSFINGVLLGKFQNDIKKNLNKIYPIVVFELRAIKRL
jgi:small subunit ribosomal protein S3Ae